MEIIDIFKSKTANAKKIIITTHLEPDADGIGSEIALCMAFNYLGMDATCVNEESLLTRYQYLDPKSTIISYKDYLERSEDKSIDLFIIVDTNSEVRIGNNVGKLLKSAKDLLYIDHHPHTMGPKSGHCLDATMAATGELIGTLIESMGVPFTKELALPLYTAIIIDTSSFRYPTVTGNTHRLIAKLMDTGIRPPQAYNMIYGTKKISHMQLLGIILSSAQTTANESIGWISMKEDDLRKFSVDTEDTHAFINNLLVLDNIEVACMFREQGDSIKISFRTSGAIDVGKMARAIGGGGHNHSAAAIIKGPMDKVIKDTITKLENMMEEEGN